MTSLSREVNKFSEIEYRNREGQIYREDGPAAIFPNGNQTWYKDGQLYGKDGQIRVYVDDLKAR